MYSLTVIKNLDHPDGRIFREEHGCNALDAFEVAELIGFYPDHFKPKDETTAAFLENGKEFIAKVKKGIEEAKATKSAEAAREAEVRKRVEAALNEENKKTKGAK
jgi:hypothetical protein